MGCRSYQRAIGAGALTLAALLGTGPSALAAETCSYSAGTLNGHVAVTMDEAGDEVDIRATGGNIVLTTGPGTPVPCPGAGGPPTVSNTGAITVTDSSPGDTTVFVDRPEEFAPGSTTDGENGGTPEIELGLNFGAGSADRLLLSGNGGTPVSEDWRLGSSGFNWNPAGDGAPDVDISFPPPPDDIDVVTFEGSDQFSAQGGAGTGVAFSASSEVAVDAGGGNDTVEGGDSSFGILQGDELFGGFGNDTVRGFGGPDDFLASPGDDDYDGGAATDTIRFSPAGGVTVDLSRTGPQDTGDGTDTVAGFEFLLGTPGPDVLTGGAGPNTIAGQDGPDTIDGGGGSNELFGGNGVDTVSYARAGSGMSVDLSAAPNGTASGDGRLETLTGFENLVGSEFGDSLTGNALGNVITGLGGNDTISALAGPDTVDVRDGGPDTASCGSELDGAVADQRSVDSVAPDCEAVDFLPEPEPEPEPDPAPPTPEDREMSFDLAGKAKQRVVKRKGVVVRASCPLEDCTVIAGGGKTRPRTEELEAGATEQLKLRVKRKRLRAIAEALEDGKKPKVKVRANATDAAGNAATDTLTVRAKR